MIRMDWSLHDSFFIHQFPANVLGSIYTNHTSNVETLENFREKINRPSTHYNSQFMWFYILLLSEAIARTL